SGAETGPLLRTILRLRHDAVMIGRASVVPLPSDLQTRLAAPLAKISDAIAVYLRSTAGALRTRAGTPAIEPVEIALQLYAAEVKTVKWPDDREISSAKQVVRQYQRGRGDALSMAGACDIHHEAKIQVLVVKSCNKAIGRLVNNRK